MVPDQASAVYSCSATSSDKITLMLGINDERIYGTNSTKQTYFKDGLISLSVYLSSHTTKAINGGSYAGTWGNTTAYGIGKHSYTKGSKLTFTINGPVLYLGYIKQANNGGQFTVKVDGVSMGTFSSNGDGINSNLGLNYGPQLLRFSGLTNSSHSVEIEVVSATSTSNRVYVDWWGTPSSKNTVHLANIPYATAYVSGGSDANVDLYNEEIERIVSTLTADGLDVRLINVNAVLADADMFDEYHPNDSGHEKIANAYLSAMGLPPVLKYYEKKIYLCSDNNWYVGDESSKILISVP